MKDIKFEKVSFGSFLKDVQKSKLDVLIGDDHPCNNFIDYTKKVYDEIELPIRKTEGSAGYDFNIPFGGIRIHPGQKIKFPTGIKAKMPKDVVLNMHIRSSLAIKYDLSIANCTGIIDSDYYDNPDNEGDIIIAIKNDIEADTYTTKENMGVAQGIFTKYEITEDDSTVEKRVGGIGSTSK